MININKHLLYNLQKIVYINKKRISSFHGEYSIKKYIYSKTIFKNSFKILISNKLDILLKY